MIVIFEGDISHIFIASWYMQSECIYFNLFIFILKIMVSAGTLALLCVMFARRQQ